MSIMSKVIIDEGETCGICLEDLIDVDNVIQLKCSHKYCYECIFNSYYTPYKSFNKKKHRECPYCRKNGGYLPLPENTLPFKDIHKEYLLHNLPKLPFWRGISYYKKDILLAIAKKVGISTTKENNKIKLKKELYNDIKTAYTTNPSILNTY